MIANTNSNFINYNKQSFVLSKNLLFTFYHNAAKIYDVSQLCLNFKPNMI